MWATFVKDLPAVIEVSLIPLPSLFAPRFVPSDASIETKASLLEAAISRYLFAHGVDPSTDRLTGGEPVEIALVGPGAVRVLGDEANTVPETAGAAAWSLVPADDGEGPLTFGSVVFVQDASGRRLDACAGGDGVYSVGDGLTALVEDRTGGPTTRWVLTRASEARRDAVVDGDYVRLQSLWVDTDGHQGFLLGEVDARDARQRVYGFGGHAQPGTLWRISRRGRMKERS